MKKLAFLLILLPSGTFLLSALAQERTKPKAASTVPDLLAQASTSFGEGKFSACLADIRKATTMVMAERAKLIRAALPPAPKGLEKMPAEEAMAGMAAAFASTVGTMVNQEYSGETKSISVNVTADSPLGQMFGMVIANPAMLEPGSEVIKYGAHKAVLKDQGSQSYELQILIDNTMVMVSSNGLSDEELLAFMNQKAVDDLVAALAK
jgi:hypothetical protein